MVRFSASMFEVVFSTGGFRMDWFAAMLLLLDEELCDMEVDVRRRGFGVAVGRYMGFSEIQGPFVDPR